MNFAKNNSDHYMNCIVSDSLKLKGMTQWMVRNILFESNNGNLYLMLYKLRYWGLMGSLNDILRRLQQINHIFDAYKKYR